MFQRVQEALKLKKIHNCEHEIFYFINILKLYRFKKELNHKIKSAKIWKFFLFETKQTHQFPHNSIQALYSEEQFYSFMHIDFIFSSYFPPSTSHSSTIVKSNINFLCRCNGNKCFYLTKHDQNRYGIRENQKQILYDYLLWGRS